MRSALVCAALLLSSAVLLADDVTVLIDEDVDFSAFHTFSMSTGRMTSERPELKFPAVLASVGDAVRAGLIGYGLKEQPDRADLQVDFSVASVDYGIGPFANPRVISPPASGRRGSAVALTVAFTEATLVIDLFRGAGGPMVLRGVFRDNEDDAQRLAAALPKNAAAIIAKYPVKKK